MTWAAKLTIMSLSVSACLFSFDSASASTVPGTTIRTNSSLNGAGSGLVGHWTFDGKDTVSNIADISGSYATGSLILGTTGNTATTTVSGRIGQAMSFDGVSDYVNVGDPASGILDFGTGSFSYCSWFRSSGINTFVINKTVGGVTAGYDILIGVGSVVGDVNGRIFDGSQEVDTPIWSGTGDGNWHHICIVASRSDQKLYLYGDSRNFGSNSISSLASVSNTSSFNIGARNAAGLFSGAIDDVRVYNRALSAAEVKRLYDLGATSKLSKTIQSSDLLKQGLIGHWTFDGKDTLSNIADLSSSFATGSLILGSTGNTATTTKAGRIGQALSFDGINDRVALSSRATTAVNNYSMSLWMNAGGLNTSGVANIMAYNGDDAGGWGISLGCEVCGLLNNISGLYGSSAWLDSGYTLSSVEAKKWHHVVLVRRSGVSEIWIDNVKFTPTNSSASPLTVSNFFEVGHQPSHANRYYKGSIDDVRVYNYALSTSTIQRLYSLGATSHISTTVKSFDTLKQGLVGHWTMDGSQMNNNIADISASYATGSLLLGSSGSLATSTKTGRIGQALEFDGVDDYIQMSTPITNFTNALTVSLWVYVTKDSPGVYSIPVAQTDYSTADTFAMEFRRGTVNWSEFVVYNSGLGFGRASTTVPSANRWHHMVGTWDGSTVQIYVDTVPGNPATLTGSAFLTNVSLRIGEYGQGSNHLGQVGGKIDDVRMYNRALSAIEIKRLYDLGR